MSPDDQSNTEIFAARSRMAAVMRAFDWSSTPLGPPQDWPQSLRSALSICLNSHFPIGLYWGPDHIVLYNDAWRAVVGEKHPWSLGRSLREAWPEFWEIIAPALDRALRRGEPAWSLDLLAPIKRRGYLEECYFNSNLSPIRGEGGAVAGVFNAILETSNRVIAERRALTLEKLTKGTEFCKSSEDACAKAAALLAASPKDAPFCLVYLLEGEVGRETARLAGAAGLPAGGPASPLHIRFGDDGASLEGWPMNRILNSCRIEFVGDLSLRFGIRPSGGPWPEPVERAVVVPIRSTALPETLVGFLVLGLSPRKMFDEPYRAFAMAAAKGVRDAIARAFGMQEERRRDAERRAIIEFALNRVHEAVYLIDEGAHFLSVNDEAVRSLGYGREELLGMTMLDIEMDWTHEKWAEHWRDIRTHGSRTIEAFHWRKDGVILPVEVTANYFNYSGKDYDLAMVRDISERRQAEVERQANLFFFESMDRISRAMHKTNHIQEVLGEVLDIVLDVFNCDRAYLVYPCDPGAPSWSAPIESTRPEYPGAGIGRLEVPMGPEVAKVFRIVLDAGGAVRFGPGAEHPLADNAARQFGCQSRLAMAVYPKTGKPWMFGLHQCSYPRVWTSAEEMLLQEIGHRLSDYLSSFLAHRELRESEARLKEAERLAHMGNWELDIVRNKLSWSDEIYRLLEIDPATTGPSYQRFMAVVHPDDRRLIDASYRESVANRTKYQIEYRLLMPDGRIKYITEQCETFYGEDGKPLRSAGMSLDITDRKRAEEALRLSEERYRTLVMATSTIVWLTDAEGKVVEDVPSWRAFTGQSIEQIKGDGWMDAVHPDDYPSAKARWMEAVRQRKPFEEPNRVRRSDGEYRHVIVRGAPVLNTDGSVREWIGACTDVTERVRAKKEADRYREHLEIETAERKRAEEALFQSQKMESIGQLTGGIAHDFNNLLTVISGNMELLRCRLPDNPAMQRFARNALCAVERAAGITAQLLAFSRSQRLVAQAIDVNDVVRGMMGLLRQTVGERIEIHLRLVSNLWTAVADRHQLETALLNLVINARDAMPEGGALTITTANRIVSTSDSADLTPGHYVALTVADTGCGVPPELATRIFEPFFTTKEVGKGTGLGLSMVYGFAKQSGGSVSVQSAGARGAAFTLCLPYTDEAMEALALGGPSTRLDGESIERAQDLRTGQGSGGVILVVEDEASVRDLAASALKSFGYSVVEAPDAIQATALLEGRNDILLVFSDIVMPRQSGLELAVAVRRRWPDIPILLTTGYTRSFAKDDMPDGVEILLKPYQPADLIRMVRTLLAPLCPRPTAHTFDI